MQVSRDIGQLDDDGWQEQNLTDPHSFTKFRLKAKVAHGVVAVGLDLRQVVIEHSPRTNSTVRKSSAMVEGSFNKVGDLRVVHPKI